MLRTCRRDRHGRTRAIAHALQLKTRATRGCGARVVALCGARPQLRNIMRTRACVTDAGINKCFIFDGCLGARKIGAPLSPLAFTTLRVCNDRAQVARSTFAARHQSRCGGHELTRAIAGASRAARARLALQMQARPMSSRAVVHATQITRAMGCPHTNEWPRGGRSVGFPPCAHMLTHSFEQPICSTALATTTQRWVHSQSHAANSERCTGAQLATTRRCNRARCGGARCY